MPIPTYEPFKEKVKPLADTKFTANATAGSFGANEARALNSVGEGLGSVSTVAMRQAIEYKEEADKAVVRDSLNTARDEARRYLNEDLFIRQGKDAINIYDDAKRKLEEIGKSYSGKLKGNQKTMFDDNFNGLTESHLNSVMSMQTQRRKEYEEVTLESDNWQATADAKAFKNDPAKLNDAVFTVKANTAYKYRGYGEDVIKAQVQKAVNGVYESVLDAHIAEGTDTSHTNGLNFLTTHWESFDPVKREVFKKSLTKGVKEETILNTARTLSESGLPIDEQMDRANKIKDAETSNKVKDELERIYKQNAEVNKFKQLNYYNAKVDEMRQSPDPAKVKIGVGILKDQYDNLKELQKKEIRQRLIDQGLAADDDEGNVSLAYSLMKKDARELMRLDLTQYIKDKENPDGSVTQGLNLKQLDELQKMQIAAKTNSEEFIKLQTPAQQIESYLDGFTDLTPDKKDSDKDKENKTQRRARALIQIEKRLKALPLEDRNRENIHNILKEEVRPVVYGKWDPSEANKVYYAFDIPFKENARKAFAPPMPDKVRTEEKLGHEVEYSFEYKVFIVRNEKGKLIAYDHNGVEVNREKDDDFGY